MAKKAHRNALPVGYELHWFKIEDILGYGGFGLTYLARDINLDRQVAIKEYMPSQISMRDEDMSIQPLSGEAEEDYKWGLNRFISEARTLTQFEHPSLVRVFNVFEANNSAYMVMNYEQGKSLKQILREGYRFSEEELCQMLFPLMEGLETVHDKGFVHRDIKPGNIFIRLDGGPVLLDFGSARQTRGGLTTRTLTNFVSPGYAPIEQYIGKSDRQGPWTDIYGLGATAYEAMVGNMPEAAIDRSAMISNDAGDNLIKASIICKGKYSDRFLNAIDHALAFNTRDRPQSISEWREEFEVDIESMGILKIPEQSSETFNVTGAGNRDESEGVVATENLVEVADETVQGSPTESTAPMARETAVKEKTVRNEDEISTEVHGPESSSEEPTEQILSPPDRSRYRGMGMTIGVIAAVFLMLVAYHTNWNVTRESSEAGLQETATTDIEDEPVSTAGGAVIPAPETNESRISGLLSAAREDIAALRLMTPEKNNAYDKFLQVLSIDQQNMEAVQGIDQITDKYLELVVNEIEEGNLEQAQLYFDRANYLRPGQPKVARVKERLDDAVNDRNRSDSLFGKIENIFR